MPARRERFAVAGLVIELGADASHPEVDARLEFWGRAARSAAPPDVRLTVELAAGRVLQDGAELSRADDPVRLLDALELAFYRALVDRTAATPLHGAGLVLPGAAGATLLAGPSGAGKSTLAGALLARGARYLADEQLFVRGREVEGLPRTIETSGGPPVRPAPEQVVTGPVPVERLVLLRLPRRADGRLEPLAPAAAAAELTTHLLRPPRPEDLRALAELAGAAPAFALALQGPERAADLLLGA